MRRLWMLGVLAGCVPPVTDLGRVPSGGAATDAGASTSLASATTGALTSTSTETSAASTGDATASSSGALFFFRFDIPGETGACDLYAQDCPPGQKCAWTAPAGESFFDDVSCVPRVLDPLPDGAPCTYDLAAPFNGIDACDAGSMCVEAPFGLDEWDGVSTCQPLCKGSVLHPYCDPGQVCVGGRALYLCVPTCDPLAQDCPVGLRCDLYGSTTLCTWDWPEEPRVGVGEPCGSPEQCELGATCSYAATPTCAGQGCCTPFCDLADPQVKCPLPGQQCRAPESWGQPVQPGLGVCGTEVP